MRRLMLVSLLMGGLVLSGCTAAQPAPRASADAAVSASPTSASAATEPPVPALPTPTAAPATIVAPEPPAADAPDAQPAQVAWADVATVDGDYFVRGNPAAPIRLVDFSDFL